MLERQAHMTSRAQPLSTKRDTPPSNPCSISCLLPVPSVRRIGTITAPRSRVIIIGRFSRLHPSLWRVLLLVNCAIMPLPARLFAIAPAVRFSSPGEPCRHERGREFVKRSFATRCTSAAPLVPVDVFAGLYLRFAFRLIMLLRTHAADWNIPACGNGCSPNGRTFVVSMYILDRCFIVRV